MALGIELILLSMRSTLLPLCVRYCMDLLKLSQTDRLDLDGEPYPMENGDLNGTQKID